jgi:hypothetical protein
VSGGVVRDVLSELILDGDLAGGSTEGDGVDRDAERLGTLGRVERFGLADGVGAVRKEDRGDEGLTRRLVGRHARRAAGARGRRSSWRRRAG